MFAQQSSGYDIVKAKHWHAQTSNVRCCGSLVKQLAMALRRVVASLHCVVCTLVVVSCGKVGEVKHSVAAGVTSPVGHGCSQQGCSL